MANRERKTFVCDGVTFDVGRLELDAAFRGLEDVVKLIGPAVLAQAQGDQAAMLALLSNASKFPALIAMFTPVTKVQRDPSGVFGCEGSFVELKPFVSDVFSGRLDLATMFLLAAVRNEYFDFLASLKAGSLAAALANL